MKCSQQGRSRATSQWHTARLKADLTWPISSSIMQISSTKTKTKENVLISGVLSVEFAKEIGIGDHGMVRREMVTLVTEGADLGGEDDASVRFENRGTGFVAKQSIGDVRVKADWRNGGSEWDYALAHFNLHSWPHVPTHLNFVNSFWICVLHFQHVFFFFFTVFIYLFILVFF